jgi:hypothetical protein
MFDFFRNTLSGWQWALLALVPPAIVALYFLKLKRQPLEVPSTYLWKRSIEDLHVNSLWQRLRQNLLLFLQLLLVALAMLALLRPGWEGAKLDGQRFIFLVDNSASMSAADVDDAPDRLAEAKRLAAGLIGQMDSSMTAMIISFADTPQVVQEFTDNRRLLLERLETIKPTARSTDLKGALELAGGLANPGRITTEEGGMEVDVVEPQAATLYIFSDGRFEDVKGFSLGNLKPVYVPIGSLEAENLAITTLSTRRSEARPEERQAFAQVTNFTDEPQSAIVELELDGAFLDAQELEVPAGQSSGVVFPLADAPAGALTARLKYTLGSSSQHDALRLDDVAYAALNDATPGRVLVVTPGNTALEVALATKEAGQLADIRLATPDVLTTNEYRRDAESGGYDLVIYDQCAPPAMPRANALLVGRLPPGPAWRGGQGRPEDSTDTEPKSAVLPQIIDWDRAHPLLAHVELGNVDIVDSLVLEAPPGSSVLVDSTAGPIAAIAPRDSYEDVVLGFEIVGKAADGSLTANTNWPRRLSFPTFWLNALEYLAGGIEQTGMDQVRPGRPVEFRPPGNLTELTVVDPDHDGTTIRRTDQDVFQFHDTDKPGVYTVQRDDQVIERFAVDLFDRAESDVRVRPSQDPDAETVRAADIRIGHVDVAAAAGRTPVRKEAWKALLAAALFVLLLEWYIYNRRVYL